MTSLQTRSGSTAPDASAPLRLVLVGVGGFGRVHAERIARLQDRGVVDLVAAVDPFTTTAPPVIAATPVYPDLGEALSARGPVDVVVVAAPIAEHVRLAEQALFAGADVLLEKPPVATLGDFSRLLAAERRTGRVIQVGFQSLGSDALRLFAEQRLGIGDIVKVTALGAWSRTVGYWNRSPWAGRRSLDGQPVMDGVVTNALAHATATALAVLGCRQDGDVDRVDVDLYRANEIESDDTSVVRIRTAAGIAVTCGYTLCAPVQRKPVVQVDGSRGRVRYFYTEDRLEVVAEGQSRTLQVGRQDLLENLLAFRRGESQLLVPLSSTGAFMRVLDAVAGAQEPVRISPSAVSWSGEGQDRRAVVDGIEDALLRVVETGRTFSELGLPWARTGSEI